MCVGKSNSGSRAARVEAGQSLVEFAFILIPFLLITIGVVEIGRAWSVKQAVTNAAREGARILILQYGQGVNCLEIDCSSANSVKEAAMNTVKFHMSGAGLSTDETSVEINFVRQKVYSESDTVTTEPLAGEMTSGDLVGVTINYKYVSTVQALLATSDNTTINMLGSCVMRHE